MEDSRQQSSRNPESCHPNSLKRCFNPAVQQRLGGFHTTTIPSYISSARFVVKVLQLRGAAEREDSPPFCTVRVRRN